MLKIKFLKWHSTACVCIYYITPDSVLSKHYLKVRSRYTLSCNLVFICCCTRPLGTRSRHFHRHVDQFGRERGRVFPRCVVETRHRFEGHGRRSFCGTHLTLNMLMALCADVSNDVSKEVFNGNAMLDWLCVRTSWSLAWTMSCKISHTVGPACCVRNWLQGSRVAVPEKAWLRKASLHIAVPIHLYRSIDPVPMPSAIQAYIKYSVNILRPIEDTLLSTNKMVKILFE